MESAYCKIDKVYRSYKFIFTVFSPCNSTPLCTTVVRRLQMQITMVNVKRVTFYNRAKYCSCVAVMMHQGRCMLDHIGLFSKNQFDHLFNVLTQSSKYVGAPWHVGVSYSIFFCQKKATVSINVHCASEKWKLSKADLKGPSHYTVCQTSELQQDQL